MREPMFTETLQIAIVVRDLEETMRTYEGLEQQPDAVYAG
jgi:hypothetical protein